jgi:hypothetical protein
MGEMRNVYNISVGKPEWKHSKNRRRWEGSDRMNRGEVWWEGAEWMHLAQDRG